MNLISGRASLLAKQRKSLICAKGRRSRVVAQFELLRAILRLGGGVLPGTGRTDVPARERPDRLPIFRCRLS